MTDQEANVLIDAAEAHAEAYNDDPRDCIKADVMNAFFAGASWQQERAASGEVAKLRAALDAAQANLQTAVQDAWRANAALSGFVSLLPTYTCKGKGGRYILIGVADGAGTSRDTMAICYRDTATGNLYFRTPADFADRMEEVEGDA